MWGCTVAEAQKRCTAREFAEWLAYQEITGPLGMERLDILAAHIVCTLANVNRGSKQRPYNLTDPECLITWDADARKRQKEQSEKTAWLFLRNAMAQKKAQQKLRDARRAERIVAHGKRSDSQPSS